MTRSLFVGIVLALWTSSISDLRGAQDAEDRVHVDRVTLYQAVDLRTEAPKGFILDVLIRLDLSDATRASLNPAVSLPNYLEAHATLGELMLKSLGGKVDGALLSDLDTQVLPSVPRLGTRRVISHAVSFYSESPIPVRNADLLVQIVRRKSDAERWVVLAMGSLAVDAKRIAAPEPAIPATLVKSYSEERVEAGGKKTLEVRVVALPRSHDQLAGRAIVSLNGAEPVETRIGGLDSVLLRFDGLGESRPGKFQLLCPTLSMKCPLAFAEK